MDQATAKEVTTLLATLIGEIMEDHIDLAIFTTAPADRAGRLLTAGEDIPPLARAMDVIARRQEGATFSPPPQASIRGRPSATPEGVRLPRLGGGGGNRPPRRN